MFVLPTAQEQVLGTRREGFAEHFIRPLVREADKLAISTKELTTMIEKERQA